MNRFIGIVLLNTVEVGVRPVHWEGAWVIRAPRERVYELMTDFEKWPEVFPDMVKSIRVVSRTEMTAVVEGDFELVGNRGRGD